MGTFLFDQIIFGPVKSRRLGISLGINLLPKNSKVCNFNCIYCECGWTMCNIANTKLHTREKVKSMLEDKLQKIIKAGESFDVITFAGNGEPTLHPDFNKIIDDTIKLRNYFFPKVRIAVLSNATTIHKKEVFEALNKVDQNILKLDSAFESTIKLLNNPAKTIKINSLVENFKKFYGNLIIQTLFIRGNYKGTFVDNTTSKEVNAWLKLIKNINPKQVMIYTIARGTPTEGLERINIKELEKIAERVEDLGIKTQISC